MFRLYATSRVNVTVLPSLVHRMCPYRYVPPTPSTPAEKTPVRIIKRMHRPWNPQHH
jgi:hypothetical protein